MEHERDRLAYLFGEERLDELATYDLHDESERLAAVDEFLPVPPGGEFAGARAALRAAAVAQILNDDPPETWRAVERMRTAGLDREEVLAQLVMVISEQVMNALAADAPADLQRLIAALDALPLPTAAEMAEVLVAVAREHRGVQIEDHIERTIAALGSSDDGGVLDSLAGEMLDDLIEGPLYWLAGDVTVVFHDTVAGHVFTHRFNESERELGVISVSVDLAGFGRFGTLRLADGRELEQFSVDRGHRAWHGPQGWLDGFQPGDLLAFTASFDPPVGGEPVEATIAIEVVADEPVMTDALVTAVRDVYDREQYEDGLPMAADELTVSLCHYAPDLFDGTLPPLSECFEAAGLGIQGSELAHDDAVWRRGLLHRRIGNVFHLVPERRWRLVLAEALDVLADPDASIDDVCASLAECARPETLDVLAGVLIPEFLEPGDEYLLDHVQSPGHVFELVGRATAVARRPREIGTAEYLACVLRERSGQPLVAAEHLARAVERQPQLGPIVERMGWYCFDRGDARGAMRWWRQLEELHPAADTIAEFLAPAGGRSKLGRNDPCWCGSGRKFKQCHQNVTDLPALPDRVAWLCRKASLWIDHAAGDARDLPMELAIAYLAGTPDADADEIADLADDEDELYERLERTFADPIIYDAALHEGGLFRRFLYERGDLLPADERLLATSWLTVERSVHEVVSVERGVGLALRNLATGDIADVRERTLSRHAKVGERYCVRVVPDGAADQIIGGVFAVRAGHESQVLDLCAEHDPFVICARAGALTQPPRLVHRPGMIDSMFDRDEIEAALADLDGADEATVTARFNDVIARQAQASWLDENIPALGGVTPREAAADPTRREQLERLLAEFDADAERFADFDVPGSIGGPITYDTAALRRELGLTGARTRRRPIVP